MALLKIEDFDPHYRDSFNGDDIKGHGVFTENDQKIGSVSDILVDEEGHLRYFVVDLGFWIFGKKVLLPVGRTRIDHGAQRVYAIGMSREQAEDLPEFNERTAVDYDYEERVRGVYSHPMMTTAPAATIDPLAVNTTAPLEASAPLAAAYSESMVDNTINQPGYVPPADTMDRSSYYAKAPELYNLNDRDHQNLRLYEERLIANKRRVKTGEVAVGKHVETDTARVSVPIEKERVVVERVTPADAGQPVAPGTANFQEGEVAHMEVYEETPEIRKEAFVREEVRIHKEVDRDTVSAEDTIRREELDIKSDGRPIVEGDQTQNPRI